MPSILKSSEMEFIIRRTSDCENVGDKPVEYAILKEFWYKEGIVVDKEEHFRCFSHCDFSPLEMSVGPINAPVKGHAWTIEVDDAKELLDIIKEVENLDEFRGFLRVGFSETYMRPLIEIVDDYLD